MVSNIYPAGNQITMSYYSVPEETSEPTSSDFVQTSNRVYELELQAQLIKNNLPKPGLRDVLHTNLQEIHLKARSNKFLNDLMSGKMNCSKEYVGYLCNLYHLHQSIERAQERIQNKYGAGHFVFPFLFRSKKILADIQLWSMMNPTYKYFADNAVDSLTFTTHVRRYVQPSVLAFEKHLDQLEDPIYAVGAMYALYGTIMSGGQLVRRGVKEAFLTRLDQKIAEHSDVTYEDDEPSRLKTMLVEKILAHPDEKEKLVEESASLFSLEEINFKPTWHEALDKLPEQLNRDISELEKTLVAESQNGVKVVLSAIAELFEFLKTDKDDQMD